VTSIGYRSFARCNGLTSINIPNNVNSIERYAFYSCENLNTVTIGTNVEKIGINVFAECLNITTVIWNAKKCESPYDDYFGYVDIFRYISHDPISGNPTISQITFGSEVIEIPKIGEINNGKIICLGSTPPAGGKESGIDNSTCTLYVNEQDYNTYNNALWWEDFLDIRVIEDGPTTDIINNVAQNPSNPEQKLFHNGTIYILRGDKIYTVTGQQVK
jgi:hypothetical protein